MPCRWSACSSSSAGWALASWPVRAAKPLAKPCWEGVTGIAPGIPLIMMAGSIKFIVTTGGVMDTILHGASQPLSTASPMFAVMIIYVLALFIELFIGSAGAKAVLMMPILLPLADLVGVTRQVTVLAYCFGDGFSNMAYPTNPVLLISLGTGGHQLWQMDQMDPQTVADRGSRFGLLPVAGRSRRLRTLLIHAGKYHHPRL